MAKPVVRAVHQDLHVVLPGGPPAVPRLPGGRAARRRRESRRGHTRQANQGFLVCAGAASTASLESGAFEGLATLPIGPSRGQERALGPR